MHRIFLDVLCKVRKTIVKITLVYSFGTRPPRRLYLHVPIFCSLQILLRSQTKRRMQEKLQNSTRHYRCFPLFSCIPLSGRARFSGCNNQRICLQTLPSNPPRTQMAQESSSVATPKPREGSNSFPRDISFIRCAFFYPHRVATTIGT